MTRFGAARHDILVARRRRRGPGSALSGLSRLGYARSPERARSNAAFSSSGVILVLLLVDQLVVSQEGMLSVTLACRLREDLGRRSHTRGRTPQVAS
jgi:hypothetical protein